MVAVITGASKGIGFKTAELFCSKGYKVIITGRNEASLKCAVKKLGKQAKYLVWDISDIQSANAALKAAHSLWGNIDVFVNNAGIVSNDDIGVDAVGFLKKARQAGMKQ